jgi:hypothetical protein
LYNLGKYSTTTLTTLQESRNLTMQDDKRQPPTTGVSAGSDNSSFEKETSPRIIQNENTGGREPLEVIRTVSRVPGNPNYYEKDGLRTYGDDEDHDHEPPVSF